MRNKENNPVKIFIVKNFHVIINSFNLDIEILFIFDYFPIVLWLMVKESNAVILSIK